MHEFTIDKCELIEESIKYIEFYTKDILEANDFRKNNEKLDTDIIFEICKIDIPILKQKIQTFLSNKNDTV